MIDTTQLWGFIPVAVVVIISPGADFLLLVRTAMADGVRAAFATFAGVHLGNLTLTTLVASGLGLVIARHHRTMLVIQVAGGLYLVWLAFVSARALMRARQTPDDAATTTDAAHAGGHRAAFSRGLAANLTNAKLLVFYLSLFPQFLGHATSSVVQLELLAAVFIALAMLWHTLVILLAGRMQHLMARPAFAAALEILCTLTFLLLGLGILAEALTNH